jgi:hypothetical protein
MKRVIITLPILFAALAALAQPPAGGAGGMPANEQIFANNDANGDGEITRAEADAAALPLSQNWDMFDQNSDGKVVAAELDAARANQGGGRAGGPGGGGAAAAAPAAADAGAEGDEDEDEDEDEEDEDEEDEDED